VNELKQYGLVVTVQLDSESDHDYLEILKSISNNDWQENIIDSIRLYNAASFENLPSLSVNPNKKLIVFYAYTNSIENQNLIRKELEAIVKTQVSSTHTHKITNFEYDDFKYTNLTKQEYWRSYYIDCYVPLSKLEPILNMEMPSVKTQLKINEQQKVIKPASKALKDIPYEVHLINNSALIRIYPTDKDPAWLDRVTSNVLMNKGVIYAKKEMLDETDPHLICRIIGTESCQIQKDIK
jgi:hypothetical protein